MILSIIVKINNRFRIIKVGRSVDQGAAKTKHIESLINFNRLSWDDLKIFLACTKAKSFRKAAEKLQVSSSTVVRRIENLEIVLGIPLFDRLPEGIKLTEEALLIRDSAHDMEVCIYELLQNRMQIDNAIKGTVSISITEGLGTYWLMPKLVNFQKQFPKIILNVQCAMKSADVLRLETDMAIQFERPDNPDLIMTKLGRLHVYPFASEKYISVYGKPTSLSDAKHHRFVLQVSPNLEEQMIWAKKLGLKDMDELIGIRTNASTPLFYAVERGAGIGVLPTYATALKAPVVPLDFGVQNSLDIWLTFHPGVKKTPRKKMVIDWIKSIFDPQIYPWFSDEFIHPNSLLEQIPEQAKENMNQHYFSVTPFEI